MAIQLFGSPNLQGGSTNLQGSNPNLQGGVNPQQTASPVAPTPVATAPRPAAPRPAPVAAAPKPVTPTAQPIQINPIYSQYVQTRPSPSNPGVLEYFNPQNQQGFSNPNDVYNYILTQTGHQITDLSQLNAPQYGSTPATAETDSYTDFANSAAQSGLSVDDYLKYLTGGVSPDERDQINNGLGIPEAYRQLFTSAPSTQELYNNAYKSAGLSDLKAQIDSKLKEINTIRQQYTDKSGTINENPFLSEASRVGRQNSLSQKQQADIGNRNNELSQLQDLYNNGIGEVNAVVGRTTQDFSNSQQINSLKLQYLQQQAEQQLADLKDSKTKAAYQYLPDYLKAKAAAQKPDTIGSAEQGYYRWNPSTGTFEQVIAPKTNALDDTYRMLQIQKLQQEIAGGGNANELLSVNDAQALGVPYGTTKGQAVQQGITPQKPATDAQNQAAGYALRIQQSSSILNNLESAIQGYNALGFEAQMKLPSYLQSGNIQSYDQAARNFINSVLRRESGAAISTGEFANAYQQYLPRPGDSAQTLAQKKQNRTAVLQSLINSSGPAYGNLTGGTGLGSASDPLGLFGEKGGGAVLAAVNTKFPDGTVGGQCGTFAHKIANFPPVGNQLSEKQATVNKSGVSAEVWRKQGAKVGDVIISNYPPYGHVEVVIAKNPDGTVVTKSSNLNLNEKVTTRTITINDSKIYGVLRGTLKI